MTSDDLDAQASTVHLAGGQVEEYLAGVRAALADLPAPEVSEIVDDVRAHLADVAADLDGEPDLAAFTARAVVPLNGLAAVLLLAVLDGSSWGTSSSVQYVSADRPGLWQDSEREIRDIRPVDSAGNPLIGVYLFDQDGRPFARPACPAG